MPRKKPRDVDDTTILAAGLSATWAVENVAFIHNLLI